MKRLASLFVGAVAFCSLLLAPSPATSQRPDGARVLGRVVDDSSGDPVAAALVHLDVTATVETGADGRFSMPFVPPGRYRIAAVGRGCATAVGVIEARAGETLEVDLRIVRLADAATEASRPGWDPAPELAGARLEVLTGQEIRQSTAATVLELLRFRVPGLVGGPEGASGDVGRLTGRGNNSATGARQPVVILDGARLQNRPEATLAQLRLEQIARIEVYRGAAGAWIHGPESANGVVRIFTRTAGMSVDPELAPEECGNPFRGKT